MNNLVAIKLKRQDVDLLGYLKDTQDDYFEIDRPVQVKLEPHDGFFAVDWLYLSESKSIAISKDEIICFSEPSERAYEIYDQFWQSMNDNKDSRLNSLDDVDELASYLESKFALKH